MTRTPPVRPEAQEFERQRALAEARWIQEHAALIARLERTGHTIELATDPHRKPSERPRGTANADAERLWNTTMWCRRCERRYSRGFTLRRLKDGSPCR